MEGKESNAKINSLDAFVRHLLNDIEPNTNKSTYTSTTMSNAPDNKRQEPQNEADEKNCKQQSSMERNKTNHDRSSYKNLPNYLVVDQSSEKRKEKRQKAKQYKTAQDVFLQTENDKSGQLEEEFKQMTWDRLEKLITKSSDEILHTILNKESGFNRLLDQEIKRDSMAYIILAIGKAVDSDKHNSVFEMILSVTSNRTFFLVKLPTYLVSLQVQNLGYRHLSSLFHRLLQFLQKFQMLLPCNAADVLLILLPVLKETCKKCLKEYMGLQNSVTLKIAEIEKKFNLFLKKYNAKEIKQACDKEKPPEVSKNIAEIKEQNNSFLKKPNASKAGFLSRL